MQVGDVCQRDHGHLDDYHVLVSLQRLGAMVHVLSERMLTNHSFCITDLEAYLEAGEYPIIKIIFAATGSYAATCVLGGLLVLLLFFSTVTTVASASRQVWAFSRDRGFPFSSWICYVRPAWEIPANAVSLH